MRLRDKLRPLIRKLEPVAKIVETATSVIGQLQKPTVFGVANAVAGGARSIAEEFGGGDPTRWMYECAVQSADLVRGFKEAGYEVVENGEGNEAKARIYYQDDIIDVHHEDNSVWFSRDSKYGLYEVVRRIADRVLPMVGTLTMADGSDFPVVVPTTLTSIRTEYAREVWRRTSAMLDGGRAILLNGRPGIGKTTIAQAIAAEANLGRVIIVDPSCMPDSSAGRYRTALQGRHLAMLSIGVLIMDDIDKMRLDIDTVERFRNNARLTIFTANNGQHDRVLDAALMRPARIDEVFTVKAHAPIRRAPFDKLDDEIWLEVCDWPCAYLNEVEKRLVAGQDLRLDDLRSRMKLRTRSGEELLGEDS